MGVIINNQNTKNLGFALVGRPSIPSSDKKYETIEVEGRDGALTKFIGYQDLKFSLNFNILFQDDIKQKLREIKGLLSVAKTLSFDDSPNFFYKIKRCQISDVETIIKSSGIFNVEFYAEPFEYESSSVLEYENTNILATTESKTVQGNGRINQLTTLSMFTKPKLSDYDLKVGDKVSFSATCEISGSEFGGYFVPRIYGSWTQLSQYSKEYVITKEEKITFKKTVILTDDMISKGTEIDFRADNVPDTVYMKWSNFKLEIGDKVTASPIFDGFYVRNNTTYFSQPVLKIFGQGNIKLFVNDELVEVKNINEGITIDSELQEAYYQNNNLNHQMLGSFPTFEIGENKIRTEGNIDKIEILPQWRWLT